MIDNYMLFNNLSFLDLHGEDRINAIIKVEEFININYQLGNNLIIIIHGIGTGILKQSIHKYLKTNKKVLAYKLDIFNEGCTIVELKKGL